MSDRGGGSNLPQIHRNRAQVALQAPALGTVILRSAADVERLYPAVAGVHLMDPSMVYDVRGTLEMGSNTFKGQNIVFVGNSFQSTFITTNSPNPLMASDGPGFFNLVSCALLNAGGRILDMDLGNTPLSILRIVETIFFGNRTAGGVGSMGRLVSAGRVTISASFFLDLNDGLEITGAVTEFSLTNGSISAGVGATAFKGLEIADTATLDSFLLSNMRFETAQAADRAMKIGAGATYARAVQIQGCSLRGPGTFLDAAGKQKSDPFVMSVGNGDALQDSVFAATATLIGNAVATVIADVGVLVPVGNGAATHVKFNGGAFVERWAISGTNAEDQVFTNIDLVTRTYEIELHCELNRGGGGTVLIGLAIAHEGSTIAESVTETEVGNAATSAYSLATLEVSPGETISLQISNDTNTNDVVMNSATWSIRKV